MEKYGIFCSFVLEFDFLNVKILYMRLVVFLELGFIVEVMFGLFKEKN